MCFIYPHSRQCCFITIVTLNDISKTYRCRNTMKQWTSQCVTGGHNSWDVLCTLNTHAAAPGIFLDHHRAHTHAHAHARTHSTCVKKHRVYACLLTQKCTPVYVRMHVYMYVHFRTCYLCYIFLYYYFILSNVLVWKHIIKMVDQSNCEVRVLEWIISIIFSTNS